MLPAEFEPTIPGRERPQPHAFDRAATGIGIYMGSPEIFRAFKIARHCVDRAGRGKCAPSKEFDELRRENRIALSCLVNVLRFFM